MSDEQLEEAFVVRNAELQILANLVRFNTGAVNQHALVLGPRGMGKTMLMRRLALLVRSDPALNNRWYPIVAPEEVYDAGTEGEIWLAALKQLADQVRTEGGDTDRWSGRYEALIQERDEGRLRAATLGALTEFSHEQGKRLLVLIENLQMVLGEQFAKDADWDLRKTLMNRSEVMMVLTATARFAKIEDQAFAAFELFRELELRPLDSDDCRRLWHAVSGQELVDQRIRPMEILTGGNPRLLAILASFGANRPLHELMDHLAELIDDHTPFLKSNIDALPPQERRVFVNLARLWEPSTARRVGDECRITSSTASAVLKSLVNRGAVVECGAEGRSKLYQVAERVYCIYYLMRLAGSDADRMRSFVRFMVPLYGEGNLVRALAESACVSEVREQSSRFGELEDILAGAKAVVPNDLTTRFGLAHEHVVAGRWDKAFPLIAEFLEGEAPVSMFLDELLVLFMCAGADDHSEEALLVLAGTTAERALEPLVVALKEKAGHAYRAPQEIEEVKRDVLDRMARVRGVLRTLRLQPGE